MAVTNTPSGAFSYPDGNEAVKDTHTFIKNLAVQTDAIAGAMNIRPFVIGAATTNAQGDVTITFSAALPQAFAGAVVTDWSPSPNFGPIVWRLISGTTTTATFRAFSGANVAPNLVGIRMVGIAFSL